MLPVVSMAAFVVFAEAGVEGAPALGRIRAVLRLALPFLAGAAVPIAVLLTPYVLTGSVGDFLNGVFVLPQAKLQGIYSPPLGPRGLVVAAPVAITLVARYFVSISMRRRIDVAGVEHLRDLARHLDDVSQLPRAVALGSSARPFSWSRESRRSRSFRRGPRIEMRRGAFLCLVVAAFMGLIQFPFGAPIYFCYVAPLFTLSAVAALRYARWQGGLLPSRAARHVTRFVRGFVWLDRGAIYFYALNSLT